MTGLKLVDRDGFSVPDPADEQPISRNREGKSQLDFLREGHLRRHREQEAAQRRARGGRPRKKRRVGNPGRFPRREPTKAVRAAKLVEVRLEPPPTGDRRHRVLYQHILVEEAEEKAFAEAQEVMRGNEETFHRRGIRGRRADRKRRPSTDPPRVVCEDCDGTGHWEVRPRRVLKSPLGRIEAWTWKAVLIEQDRRIRAERGEPCEERLSEHEPPSGAPLLVPAKKAALVSIEIKKTFPGALSSASVILFPPFGKAPPKMPGHWFACWKCDGTGILARGPYTFDSALGPLSETTAAAPATRGPNSRPLRLGTNFWAMVMELHYRYLRSGTPAPTLSRTTPSRMETAPFDPRPGESR